MSEIECDEHTTIICSDCGCIHEFEVGRVLTELLCDGCLKELVKGNVICTTRMILISDAS